MAHKWGDHTPKRESLRDRRERVLKLVRKRVSIGTIGRILGVSARTVERDLRYLREHTDVPPVTHPQNEVYPHLPTREQVHHPRRSVA